ncbi:MAG: mechanosensitive ion channel family protein [Promethearchaeia archaeon]
MKILAQTILEDIADWFTINILPFGVSIATLLISYVIYLIIKNSIQRLAKKGFIIKNTAKNLISLIQILIITIDFIVISIQFGETFGFLAGILTAAGGTIIGFASINTLGNLIAGLIIMTGKPFEVGDRIMFIGKLADIIKIKLMFTILEDINGVTITVPNQKMLKKEIENYGKNKVLRREVKITADYDTDPDKVEKALLEAAEGFNNILQFPEPRVELYEFDDYAIIYRLLVYINNSKIIPNFDYDLRKAVFLSCKNYGVEIRTPTLIQRVGSDKKKNENPEKQLLISDEEDY